MGGREGLASGITVTTLIIRFSLLEMSGQQRRKSRDRDSGRVRVKRDQSTPFQERHRCPLGSVWMPRHVHCVCVKGVCWNPGDLPVPEGVCFQVPEA